MVEGQILFLFYFLNSACENSDSIRLHAHGVTVMGDFGTSGFWIKIKDL
jgi:hypothetical protein